MAEKYTLLLVDDHFIVRNGIKMLMEHIPEVGKIYEAGSAAEAIKMCHEQDFDIIFMDINMPDMNGMEATEVLLKMKPHLKIVCLSMHGEYAYVSKMLSLGVSGYLMKDCEPEEFPLAVRTVGSGKKYYGKGITDMLIERHTTFGRNNQLAADAKVVHEITPRELEIVSFIVQGLTNVEIAQKLMLSSRTIDAHRRNILQKTNCKNTAALVKYALDNRLV